MTFSDSNLGVPEKTDLSISMEKANIYSLAFAIPSALLLIALYLLRWEGKSLIAGINLLFENIFLFLAVFFLGTLLHELIHALTWILVGRKPPISINFGFQLKTLTPYAHCKEPLPVNVYRIGGAMPGILLGLLPALIGIMNGNGWLFVFGVAFTAAAGGDFLILWLIRNVGRDKLVEDHPTRAGCYIHESKPIPLEPE